MTASDDGGAYGSLAPEPGRPAPPAYRHVGALGTLLRGARKRCPRCGERRTFDGWFQMRTACPRCELRFAKEEGGFLGALTLNFMAATLVWIALLVAVLVATVPDVPVAPLIWASVAVMIVVPLWFYPRSKMTWAAVEFLVLRSDPDYRPPVVRDRRARGVE